VYLCISEEGHRLLSGYLDFPLIFPSNTHPTFPGRFLLLFLRLWGDCCKVFIYTHVPCAATPMTTFRFIRSIRLFVYLSFALFRALAIYATAAMPLNWLPSQPAFAHWAKKQKESKTYFLIKEITLVSEQIRKVTGEKIP